MVKLTVKTLDAQNHSFEVDDDITVAQFKVLIADTVNIPADTQRIIYCGRVLQDTSKLSDYDVDGKVVHLVQRPPPSSTNARTGNRIPSPPPQPTTRRLIMEPGNTMYLGSMSFPANIMDSQGFVPPPPTHSLAGSRLIVARRMLRRAEAVIRVLENPSARPTDNTPPEEAQEEVTPVIEARVIVPSSGSEPMDDATVLSVVHDTLLNAAGSSVGGDDTLPLSQNAETSQSQSLSSTPEAVTPTRSSTENLASAEQRPETNNTTNNPSGSFPENASRTSEMAELLTMLSNLQLRFAPFLERYHNFMLEDPVVAPEDVRQMQAMLTRVSGVLHFLGHAYHSLSDIIIRVRTPPPRPLLCRPILIQHSAVVQAGIPIQVEAQINVSTDRPSTNTAASDSANSDATQSGVDSSTTATPANPSEESPPANTVPASTGAPSVQPQVQPVMSFPFLPGASMRVQYRSVPRQNGSSGPQTSQNNNNNTVRSPDEVSSTSAQNSVTADSLETQADSASPTVVAGTSSEATGSPTATGKAGAETATPVVAANTSTVTSEANTNCNANAAEPNARTGAASEQQQPQILNITSFNNPNVEFFMEVTPEVLQGGTPPPELLQSLMQMAGQVIGRTGANATATTSTPRTPRTPRNPRNDHVPPELINSIIHMAGVIGRTVHPPNTTASTENSQAQPTAPPAAGQNSQARVNAQTNLTTATHTRSTARPHVHLAQQAMQGGFDPFLPCNSHHLPPRRRMQVHNGGHTVQVNTSTGPAATGSGPDNRNRLGAYMDNVLHTLRTELEETYERTQGDAATRRRAGESRTGRSTATGSSGGISLSINNPRAAPTNDADSVDVGEGDLDSLLRTIEMMQHNMETEGNGSDGDRSTTGGSNAGDANNPYPFHLNHVLLELQNARSIPGFQGPTLAELLHLEPPHFNFNRGESIVTDLAMLLAQNITLGDVLSFGAGQFTSLNRIRSQIANFFNSDILQNETGPEAIDRGVDRILAELQPFLENFRDLPVREDIDMVRSAEVLFRNRLHNIISIASSLNTSSSSNTIRQLVEHVVTSASHLCALTLHCSATGQRGVEEMFDRMVSRYMQNIPRAIQQWTVVSSRIQLRHFMARSNIPISILQPYIVRRSESRVPSINAEAAIPVSAVTTTQEPEAMEVDEHEATGSASEVSSVASSTVEEDPEPLPNVVIGSERWHNDVPADWVPIITRDVQRQRRQSPQRPFSDAYLSGMPSKRRKIVNSSKPQGSLSQAITDSVKRAVTASGLTTAAPLETVAQAAGSSPEVQTAYRSLLRTSVQDKLKNDKDFTPDRFPNASQYFNTH